MTNITDTIAISVADVFIIVDFFLLSYFRVIITYHYRYVKFFIIYNILLVNTYILNIENNKLYISLLPKKKYLITTIIFLYIMYY